MKFTTPLMILSAAVLAFFPTQRASAVAQRFVNADEATVLPKGAAEFESTIDWGHGHGLDTFEFKHEIEWGLTDSIELDFYLSEWSIERVKGGGTTTTWGNAGVEALFAFSNPNTATIGSALSLEVQFGQHGTFELEPRLRLQKNFGKVLALYNVGLNAHWDDDGKSGEVFQSLGVSAEVNPHFFAGVNLTHVAGLEDWKNAEHELYLGPALHYRKGNFWATTEMGFKLYNKADDAADFHLGVRFGFQF